MPTATDPFGFVLEGDEARELDRWYASLDAQYDADPEAVAAREEWDDEQNELLMAELAEADRLAELPY